MYMDGAEIAQYASALSLAVGCDGGLNIGADKELSISSYWSGLIDDVRIYNGALSEEEIADLAQ